MIDSILFWRKPRGVCIKMNNGRLIPCRVVRDRSEDTLGQRAWRAVPREPFGPNFPLWVTADVIPAKTTIVFPLGAGAG